MIGPVLGMWRTSTSASDGAGWAAIALISWSAASRSSQDALHVEVGRYRREGVLLSAMRRNWVNVTYLAGRVSFGSSMFRYCRTLAACGPRADRVLGRSLLERRMGICGSPVWSGK